jgi:hypothetical protein
VGFSGCPFSVRLLTFHTFDFLSRSTEPILTRLCYNHRRGKGIQFCSNEGERLTPRADDSKKLNKNENLEKYFLQNQIANFNQT